MTFLRLFEVEILKLRRLMAVISLVGGPALVGLLMFPIAAMRAPGVQIPSSWNVLLPGLAVFWALFVFPLSVMAFAAFYAQIEHRARAWDHILALPTPKWLLFSVKALVVIAATVAMHVVFLAFAFFGGWLGGLVSSLGPLRGPFGLEAITWQLAFAEGASLMTVAVQLWLSLRFSSFAAPVMIGIGAFILSGAAYASSFLGDFLGSARYIPWIVPIAMNGAPSPLKEQLLFYGLFGGLLLMAAAVIDLSRREMR
jgi:ABC-2 type transport system permease protein